MSSGPIMYTIFQQNYQVVNELGSVHLDGFHGSKDINFPFSLQFIPAVTQRTVHAHPAHAISVVK